MQTKKTNSKCVSTLLNTNNWINYLDNENGTEKAESAIGSPTIEMWMDSWNARYPGDKVYRKASTDENYPGYYLGTSVDPTGSYYIDSSEMNQKEGYKNSRLYYPHTSDSNKCNGYWLASPCARSGTGLLEVDYHGTLSYSGCGDSNLGLRPVVSLNSGITVNAEDAE